MNSQTPYSFTEQMRLARSGSDEALGELVESCRAYLLHVANKELDADLRQKVAASDLVQDTFMQVRQQLRGFRGETEQEWRGWLRQILIHDLQDAHRHWVEARKRQIAREVPLGRSERSGGAARALASDSLTPQSRAIAHEEAQVLSGAMSRLSEDHQEVIRLRNWQLLPFEEIGRQIGRTAEAARKLWSRAVERLQVELEKQL